MIKNDQQMKITEQKLAGMKTQLEAMKKKYPKRDEFQFYSETTQRHVEDMKRELHYYRLAKRGAADALLKIWNTKGAIHPVDKTSLSLGDFISLMRVARRLTQDQLAATMGLDQAHIARYERSDYTGYTIDTLDRIFHALQLRLTLGKLKLPEAA